VRPSAAAVVLLSVVAAPPAFAHPMAPALLELRELDGGSVAVLWKTPRTLPSAEPLEPRLPESCRAVDEPAVEATADAVLERWQAACGRSLVGTRLAAHGLAENAATAIVRVALADGRSVRALLSEHDPSFVVPERESKLAVLAAYVRLGVEHLAFGLDHLLFVLGLFLLLGSGRALVAAITSFTLGHSVTLALATLGMVSFPQRLAEAAIAGSILALAVELENRRLGQGVRWIKRPAAMALGFGLLHGLGFAGALSEIGLPAADIPLALFGFNVGIEVAQLGYVTLLVAIGFFLPRLRFPAPAYAIGSLAAYWCFDRAAALFGA